MNTHDYRHKAEYRLLLAEGSDSRGPGAAVTVALCGHWEHEGDCPWPHLSAMEAVGDRTYRLIVQFDAPHDELDAVKAPYSDVMSSPYRETRDRANRCIGS